MHLGCLEEFQYSRIHRIAEEHYSKYSENYVKVDNVQISVPSSYLYMSIFNLTTFKFMVLKSVLLKLIVPPLD